MRDPTGCNTGRKEVSVYRRQRLSANLTRLVEGPNGPVLMADDRAATLRDQAIDAALVHEEAARAPDEEQLQRILDFETQVMASQYADDRFSGKCDDVGAIGIPQFYGLAARPPYFSNGSAATLEELVDAYRDRLNIRFRPEEKRDLVNYLSSR